MATTLQPVPSYALPFIGNDAALRELGLKFNPQWLKWFLDLIDTIQSGGGVDHNTLSGLQGGTASQYYHLRAPGSAGVIPRSNGTNWLATTSTFADTYAQGSLVYAATANAVSGLAIGTSGKVLQSNGTVPGWSTATFPTSVGAAGTILRSDGTNWLASTATYPDTATVNQVLYGTSANVIGGNAAFLFNVAGTTNGLTLAAGTVSDAITHTLTRTVTDATAGTKALLRIGTVNTDPASGSAATYAAMWLTNQTPATNAQNFTGTLTGSFYEATHRGSGTLAFLTAVVGQVVQSAGSGAVSVQRTFNSNVAIGATTTNSYGFQVNIQVNNAAGVLTTHVGFDQQATGTITAGGVLTNAFGTRIANLGKTGVTHAVGLASANQSGAATTNVNLLLGTITPPGVTASIYNSSVNNNFHSGNSFFGGTTTPTAKGHFGAGGTAASSAPIKLTTGTSMTAAEAGAVEYTTDDLFFTIATGTARKRITFADPVGGLTSGRIPQITTNGRLTDSATLTVASDVITALGFTGPHNGTLGMTSPNTLAATTGAFSGNITVGTATARVTIGDGAANSDANVVLKGSNSAKNWLMSMNLNALGFEITPSTAGGGTTFTTPAFTILAASGAAAFIAGVTLGTGSTLTLDATGADTVTGNATLVAGTVTVNTTAVTANSKILLTRKTSGGTIGTSITYTISAGTSFTITSDNTLDTSVFTWVIFEGV